MTEQGDEQNPDTAPEKDPIEVEDAGPVSHESTPDPAPSPKAPSFSTILALSAISAGLAGVIIGGIGGYAIGNGNTTNTVANGGTSSSSSDNNGLSDVAVIEGEDTAGGWSEEGAAAEAQAAPRVDPNAPLPTNVNAANNESGDLIAYGWNYNEQKANRPTVILWEDFQCPACAAFEKAEIKTTLTDSADKGDINLVYRPIGFLDQALRNDATKRATNAWGCAIDAGIGAKYHSLVFANQPAVEGDGFRDQDLLQGGQIAGLEGAAYDDFKACVEAGTYNDWALASTLATPPEVGGTPTVMIENAPVDQQIAWDPEQVKALIEEARK